MGRFVYPLQDLKKYSYLDAWKEGGTEEDKNTMKQVENLLSVSKSNIDKKLIGRSFAVLNALSQKERASEIAWLQKMGLQANQAEIEKGGVQLLLEEVNKVLNDEAIYRDAIARIRNAGEDGNKREAKNLAYTIFNHRVPKFIKDKMNEFLQEQDMSKDLDTLIQTFINRMKEILPGFITDELKKGYANTAVSYGSFLESLGEVGTAEFIDDIFRTYNFDFEKMKQYALDQQSKNKEISTGDILKNIASSKGAKTFSGGNFEKLVQSLALQSLNGLKDSNKELQIKFEGLHTGSMNQMKADSMLFSEQLSVQFSEEFMKALKGDGFEKGLTKVTKSIREQNIMALEKILPKMAEIKQDILFISDKNYNLTAKSFAEEGGFKAENPNLKTLEAVLKRTNNVEKINDLIFVLANSGEQMINGTEDSQEFKEFISSQIANFLFDDVVLSKKLNKYSSTLNRVHFFNLNGVFVPLSVFLEAAFFAFTQNEEELEDYVKVDFVFSEATFQKEKHYGITHEDLTKFYNTRMGENKVNIHFFGNFINFITSNARGT